MRTLIIDQDSFPAVASFAGIAYVCKSKTSEVKQMFFGIVRSVEMSAKFGQNIFFFFLETAALKDVMNLTRGSGSKWVVGIFVSKSCLVSMVLRSAEMSTSWGSSVMCLDLKPLC